MADTTTTTTNDKKRSRPEDHCDTDIVLMPTASKRPRTAAEKEYFLVSLQVPDDLDITVIIAEKLEHGAAPHTEHVFAIYPDAFAFLVQHGVYFAANTAELYLASQKAFKEDIFNTSTDLKNKCITVELQYKDALPGPLNGYIIRVAGTPKAERESHILELRVTARLCASDGLGLRQFNADASKPLVIAAPAPPRPAESAAITTASQAPAKAFVKKGALGR